MTTAISASRVGVISAAVAGSRVNRRATLLISAAALGTITLGMFVATMLMTRGSLTYIIDDAYIHLTMARNLAFHGTWGMVPGEFESSSSSPGWVLLIAGLMRLAPAIAEWLPLIVNAAACLGILAVFARCQDIIAIRGRSPWRIVAVALLPAVLFLPALIQLGMEHSLHTLLVLLILLQLEAMLRGDLSWRRMSGYGLLLLLATALRLETAGLALGCGLVLIAPCLVGAARRRRPSALFRRTAAFAVSGIAPTVVILAIGIVDLAHGQYFFPNSIVEKTHLIGSSVAAALLPDLSWIWSNLSSDPFMLVVIGFGVLAVAQGVRLRSVWIAWFIATAFQATYAQFGWYERYQAYLLISGVLLALRSAPEIRLLRARPRQVIAMAVLLMVLPIVKYWNVFEGPNAAANQFFQQQQMALFLSRYYDGQTVMVNDIGHVTWMHSGGLVDMWALGSFDVLQAQRGGYYNAAYMTTLAAQRNVAVVAEYSPSFDFLVPHGFVQVASWRLRDDTDPRWQAIVFWAPDGQATAMRAHMRDFIATMPEDRLTAQIDGSPTS
jgi:hypothetical protein